MDVDEKSWVADTLREYRRKRCVKKFLRLRDEPATSRGENYGSDLFRLQLEAELESGEVQTGSVLVKRLPAGPHIRQLLINMNILVIEEMVYSEVLPKMDRIVEVNTPGEEPFHAALYGQRKGECLVLQDLKPLGYKLAGDRKGLDFEHCSMVMDSIAKFHALGAILRQSEEINIADYDKYYMFKKTEFAENLLKNNLIEMAWIVENKWGWKWRRYADRLRASADRLGHILVKAPERSETGFNALLHGDLWFANTMFKYSKNGKPMQLRLVDFQLAWYNSVAFDLNYFFWTSVHGDCRHRKTELLEKYQSSLELYLRLYGYRGEPPKLRYLEEEVRRTEVFGLFIALTFLGFMMARSSGEIPDINNLAEAYNTSSEVFSPLSRQMEETEDSRMTMATIIEEAARSGLI